MTRFSIVWMAALAGALQLHAQPAAPPSTLNSQPATTNHVLELDGGHVELPPNIFNDLTQATAEAWVRWDDLSGYSGNVKYKRVFDYGDARRDISLSGGFRTTNALWYVICEPQNNLLYSLVVPGLLQPHQWCHVAGVSGPSGMKLYFNGFLVATNAYTGSFASLKSGERNFLGQTVTTNDPATDFRGAIDDFQVWRIERTEAQIRQDMFRHATGSEPGLVGLWNFDDITNGVAKDLSPGHHDGKMIGNARVAESLRPSVDELHVPIVISGRVLDETGQPWPVSTWN